MQNKELIRLLGLHFRARTSVPHPFPPCISFLSLSHSTRLSETGRRDTLYFLFSNLIENEGISTTTHHQYAANINSGRGDDTWGRRSNRARRKEERKGTKKEGGQDVRGNFYIYVCNGREVARLARSRAVIFPAPPQTIFIHVFSLLLHPKLTWLGPRPASVSSLKQLSKVGSHILALFFVALRLAFFFSFPT